MNAKIVLSLIFINALLLSACKAPVARDTALPEEEPCLTAQEIIDSNLKAIGGADRIRAIDRIEINCTSGSALLTPTEETTIYLQKPDLIKQESIYRTLLNKGNECTINAGGRKRAIEGDNYDLIRYRIGFYHNAFSLLAWEKLFPSVELVEIKRYGPNSQYVLNFPNAVNQRDLMVYIDTRTFLIDRLVFTIAQEGANVLSMVNRLRDYKKFSGLLVPTRLVFDKVGWEEAPSHFIIQKMELNPEIDPAVFENCDLDYGEVVVSGNQVKGEMRGTSEDTILTNLTLEKLMAIDVKELDWVELKTESATIKVRVLRNIQASAKVLKHDELYLCGYPISGYPRLMIMSLGLVVQEHLPYAQGRALIASKCEAPGEEQETNNEKTDAAQGGDHEE